MIIYGASDDLIEIDGGWREEINAYAREDETRWIACSDGTLLSVTYGAADFAGWKFQPLVVGALFDKVICAVGEDNGEHPGYPDVPPYSDIVLFSGDLLWVALTDKTPARPRGGQR